MDIFLLVVFLVQINQMFNMIDNKIKKFIKKKSLEDSPNETCGFIVEENNEFKCIPTTNIAKNKQINFEISGIDFLNIKSKYNIIAIYHSHTNDFEDFSEQDKKCAEAMNCDLVLYFIRDDIFKVYEPLNKKNNKYIGRYFELGKYDCFSLVKDFYEKEKKIILNYDKNIYSQNLESMNVENEALKFYEKNNLKQVSINEIKSHDILLMDSFILNKAKHFAIYLGNDKILHQPLFGFSKIDNYCNFYKRHTAYAFRSKEND